MTQIRSYLEVLMAVDDRPLRIAEGEALFEEGGPGRDMYIVRTGTVILRAGRRKLETVGPGGVVGEMALIDPAPRSATALAGSDCTVTAVNEHAFIELVKRVPALALEVMRIMARRLRRANKARKTARRRSPARPTRKAPRRQSK